MHTSVLEGVNNRIKVIKRMAYGFRDSEYFFLKIKAAFPESAMNPFCACDFLQPADGEQGRPQAVDQSSDTTIFGIDWAMICPLWAMRAPTVRAIC